jgi:hypothetical protein
MTWMKDKCTTSCAVNFFLMIKSNLLKIIFMDLWDTQHAMYDLLNSLLQKIFWMTCIFRFEMRESKSWISILTKSIGSPNESFLFWIAVPKESDRDELVAMLLSDKVENLIFTLHIKKKLITQLTILSNYFLTKSTSKPYLYEFICFFKSVFKRTHLLRFFDTTIEVFI